MRQERGQSWGKTYKRARTQKKGQKDKDIEGYQVWQVTEKDKIELQLDRIKDQDKATGLNRPQNHLKLLSLQRAQVVPMAKNFHPKRGPYTKTIHETCTTKQNLKKTTNCHLEI